MTVALALVIATAPVHAAPKGKAAKAAFDRGVAAYTKKDYPAAAEALAKSYELEADVETLFAWAQAERQQDHCDRAVELYAKLLLDKKLPDANRKVIAAKSDECKAIIAAQKPEPRPEPTLKPEPALKPEPRPEPVAPEPGEPARDPNAPIDGPASHGSPWWKDPVGDGLVAVGLVGLVAGGYFLISANGASSDAKAATNYFEAERLNDKADSQGTKGVIASIAGGVLLVGGIVRYATRSSGKRESTTVTGWVTPDSGGLAAFGRF